MENYIKHLEKSFENAENGISDINHDIIMMEGMTGTKTRHFYNNLLKLPDARYLEVGTWKGSSVCSAMCNNKAKVVCIDNWTQFGGPRNEFEYNFNKFKGKNDAVFIESDCFTVNKDLLGKSNIYLFDGEHSQKSHYKALEYFLPCLDDTFIFIIDDWNWPDVRIATDNAINNNKLNILWNKEIRLTNNDMHTHETPDGFQIASNTWWNGISVFVLQKS